MKGSWCTPIIGGSLKSLQVWEGQGCFWSHFYRTVVMSKAGSMDRLKGREGKHRILQYRFCHQFRAVSTATFQLEIRTCLTVQSQFLTVTSQFLLVISRNITLFEAQVPFLMVKSTFYLQFCRFNPNCWCLNPHLQLRLDICWLKPNFHAWIHISDRWIPVFDG